MESHIRTANKDICTAYLCFILVKGTSTKNIELNRPHSNYFGPLSNYFGPLCKNRSPWGPDENGLSGGTHFHMNGHFAPALILLQGQLENGLNTKEYDSKQAADYFLIVFSTQKPRN